MLGDLDVSKPDFTLSALLEQRLLDFIIAQAGLQPASGGFASAQRELDKAEDIFKGTLEKAQKYLETARARWECKRAEAEKDFHGDIQRLQGEVDKAQSAYNALVANAERSLRGHAAMAVDGVRAESNASTNGDPDNAEKDLSQMFCDVLGDLESAEYAIRRARGRVFFGYCLLLADWRV